MRSRRLLLGLAALLAAFIATGSVAHAAALYDVKATWGDTNLPPGGKGQFEIQARNIGTENGKGTLTIEDHLPAGVTATHIEGPFANFPGDYSCSGLGSEIVKCKMSNFFASEFELPGGGGFGLAQAPGTKTGQLVGLYPTGYLPLINIDVAISPVSSGTGTNAATISGGGAAAPVSDVDQIPFSAAPSAFGLAPGGYEADVFDNAAPFGAPVRQAGDHPFEHRFNFDFTEGSAIGRDGTPYITPHGEVKTAEVTLARGMIGNPEALPKCDPVDFSRDGSSFDSTGCPADTQVGYLNGLITGGPRDYGKGGFFFNPNEVAAHVPIYNLVPPKGTPVDLGFNAGIVQAHIFAVLDPAQNYAIKSVTPNISSVAAVRGSEVVIWGVPADPAHDPFRYYSEGQENGDAAGAPFGSAAIRPYLTNPADCGFDNGGARIRVDSYEHPGQFTPVEEYPNPLNVTGCEDPRFRFEPDIALQPTDRHAGAPTGLDVHLKVPQRNDEVSEAEKLYAENGFVQGVSTPPIKKAVVTFPPGMTLSPSAAQGLGSCSAAQIGLGTDSPVTCPDNSQYGTLTLHTPILPQNAQPEGWIYIAKQSENPFHNFLSLYLVIQEPDRGILIKIPAKLELDPNTGQITSTFDELPQFPVSDMQMTLKGGVRAGLVEPTTCGTKTITAEFFSWQDPGAPHPVKSSYDITEKPDGSPCVASLGERPFRPQMEAGTISNTGGEYAPFAFHLTRTDDDQEFSQLGLTLPPGLAAKFAGVGACPDAGIARAISRTGAGDGALEQADPSCPASSLIGATNVGVGVGVPLTYVPGRVYLAGPYNGAPISIVVISPAVVGPYDLGVIAVRTALSVNPTTAQGSALTDPFPQIFQGIPVRIRDIRVNLNRPGFILNPTSCAEKQIAARITGTGGDVNTTADDTAAELTNRYQAADCASLGFKPSLSFRLFGGTHRGAHPKLRAIFRPGAGQANIGAFSVTLPRSEFIENAHFKTICTRVQFAAGECPAGSIYGSVKAISPLFDFPLEGNIYLRSNPVRTLPDMVAVLKGPASMPIEIDSVGQIDSINGGIRTTFETVPDAPVSEIVANLPGGEKGLFVNSTNLCASTNRVTARFSGQNGKQITLHPAMQNSCKGKARHKRHRARHR